MGEKDFTITTDDILGVEGKKQMKEIMDAYLATIAPDKDYKTISIEFNNKTQKYDIHIEPKAKQGKVPAINIIKE